MNNKKEKSSLISRRNFVKNTGIIAAAGIAVLGGGASTPAQSAVQENRKSTTVPLNWQEVWLYQLPDGVRQQCGPGTGLDREEYKKTGVEYAYSATPREQLVPALHPQPRQPDPFRRFISPHPCSRGHPPDQTAGMTACTASRRLHGGASQTTDIYRITDLKGKKIGLSKSLNTIKNDWWRIQEEQGIENS